MDERDAVCEADDFVAVNMHSLFGVQQPTSRSVLQARLEGVDPVLLRGTFSTLVFQAAPKRDV